MEFFHAVDQILIAPYRWPGDPVLGWWTGTLILALWTVLIGRATAGLAFRMNRSLIQQVNGEVIHHYRNSIKALKAGDKTTYRAINELANDAFGRTYFLQIATGASLLWPIPFALAWLNSRFSGIQFPIPLLKTSVSCASIFIPLYILMRLMLYFLSTRWRWRRAAKQFAKQDRV